MTKKFSTMRLNPTDDPLDNLPFIFHDEFNHDKFKLPPLPPTYQDKPQTIMVIQSISQLQDTYGDEANIPKIDTDSNDNKIISTEQTILVENKINYSTINPDDLTIEQLLQLKLDQHGIQNVTIKHLGYNTIDEYIITEYDVIDNQTKKVLLIINVHLKQVRFQIPKSTTQITEPKKRGPKPKTKSVATPLEQVAREMQKQLKYSWSDWF